MQNEFFVFSFRIVYDERPSGNGEIKQDVHNRRNFEAIFGRTTKTNFELKY